MIMELDKLVEKINELPTLPTVVMTLNERLSSERTSVEDVADVIENDQSLASQVLRLANSSFFGFKNKIVDIQQAISLMGFVTVSNLVLAASVMRLMRGGQSTPQFNPERLWNHAIATAVAAKIIVSRDKGKNAGEVFVAGLLHDIGKIVVQRWFTEPFEAALNLHRERRMPLYEAERELLSYTHCDVGYALGRRWRLPSSLLMAIKHHHSVEAAAEFQDIVAVVHVADIVTQAVDLGHGGSFWLQPIDKTAWASVGLKADELDSLMPRIIEEAEQTGELLGMTF